MLEFILLSLIIIIYFFPGIIAKMYKHKHAQAIFAANFFFGWTGIGWIICFIWAQCK